MTNELREEFYNKFKYNKPDYDEIADWWLSKIEAVINDIPKKRDGELRPDYTDGWNDYHDEAIQQLRLKYLGK